VGRGETLGEFQLNTKPVVFVGKDRVDAKRRALDYWYRQPRRSGLSLREFLGRCRLSHDCRITYFPAWRGIA
jgi:hypothetical protein